ncbi:Rrf2 family transcriptional regulator [Streptomyces sp. NBC_00885]|uniref:hypothetical protein n=1 Tax=Streptomyces sp. NBC_00885 TaxID=2975857 RepID=UPI00387012D7|nr:Rrf2 family transcriptional regulator [Streptomyces sp. NBC_00885]
MSEIWHMKLDVSASYLAKQLQALSRAGLVRSPGRGTVDRCDHIEHVHLHGDRRRVPPATPAESCAAPCPIAHAMTGAAAAWREALRSVAIPPSVCRRGRMPGSSAWVPVSCRRSSPRC